MSAEKYECVIRHQAWSRLFCILLGNSFTDVLVCLKACVLSFFSTAKGVEHFKAGNYETAMKYFKHALQIDGENVEALVARGAL